MSPDAKLAELLKTPAEPKPPKPLVLKPGVHMIDRAEYDLVHSVNFSTLKLMALSPAHYKAALEARQKGTSPETDAMRLGRAVDLAVFEPKLFDKCVARWDGKVRNGNAWRDFESDHMGELILTANQHQEAIELSAKIRNAPHVQKYLGEGSCQVTVAARFTKPAEHGLPGWAFDVKGRLDRLAPGFIVDLKTAADGEPDAFRRSAWSLEYAVQGAFYVDLVKAVTGKKLPYVLIVAEKGEPHVVSVWRLSDLSYRLARERYLEWLDRLALCQRENHWPGYAEGELELDPPDWILRQMERES
jgi:hypothetical protein